MVSRPRSNHATYYTLVVRVRIGESQRACALGALPHVVSLAAWRL
jgi:hypothetical protein